MLSLRDLTVCGRQKAHMQSQCLVTTARRRHGWGRGSRKEAHHPNHVVVHAFIHSFAMCSRLVCTRHCLGAGGTALNKVQSQLSWGLQSHGREGESQIKEEGYDRMSGHVLQRKLPRDKGTVRTCRWWMF